MITASFGTLDRQVVFSIVTLATMGARTEIMRVQKARILQRKLGLVESELLNECTDNITCNDIILESRHQSTKRREGRGLSEI